MRLLSATCSLAISCAHGPGPSTPVDAWVPVPRPAPALCVPAPAAKLSRSERSAWASGIEALQGADHAAATAAFAEIDPDLTAIPTDVALLQRSLQDGSLRTVIEGISNRLQAASGLAPDNPCLQLTTGLAALFAGRSEAAGSALDAARRALPDHPEVAAARHLYLQAYELPASDDEPTLQQAAERFPQHPTLQYLWGLDLMSEQRAAEAIAPLEVAAAAGIDVVEPLLLATRAAGDLDRYLRLTASLGLPLGDGGALAQAESPSTAFAELLGVDEDGTLMARIETSEGTLSCSLLWKSAPVTVGNFVGLARGTQPWLDPATGETVRRPLYNGTVLHRVIPGFMIQGGDPTGTGAGGPGYRFMDETVPLVRSFDEPGLLAMANSGPGTNGSQWFVTEVPVPYLDGRHTIFGECDTDTLQVVKRIARMPVDAADKPQEPVVVERITIGSP